MDTDDGKRPDLVFYNMSETNKVVIGDIRITCPIPVCENTSLSLNKAREPDRATAASRREKENKYDDTCANNGFESNNNFESTGRIEKSCEIFLIKALKKNQKIVIQP